MLKGNQLTREIISSAIEVHRNLGPGLLESTYEECLVYELQERKFTVERQLEPPILYKGNQLEQHLQLPTLKG